MPGIPINITVPGMDLRVNFTVNVTSKFDWNTYIAIKNGTGYTRTNVMAVGKTLF